MSLSGGPHSRQLVPGHTIAAVTPSDTVDLPSGVCRALYISTAGNIVVITESGDTVGPIAVFAGTYFLVKCSRVKATSTTATVWAIY